MTDKTYARAVGGIALLGALLFLGMMVYSRVEQLRSEDHWNDRLASEHQKPSEWETTKRTPTLYLYLPSSGSFAGYWEQPLNKNFDLIDEAYRKELDRLRVIESRVSAIDGKRAAIVTRNPPPPLPANPTAYEMNAKAQFVDECYRQELGIEADLDRRIRSLGRRR